LAIHNPKIDWEKKEVNIMKCPPLCGKLMKVQKQGKKEIREDKKKIVR